MCDRCMCRYTCLWKRVWKSIEDQGKQTIQTSISGNILIYMQLHLKAKEKNIKRACDRMSVPIYILRECSLVSGFFKKVIEVTPQANKLFLPMSISNFLSHQADIGKYDLWIDIIYIDSAKSETRIIFCWED